MTEVARPSTGTAPPPGRELRAEDVPVLREPGFRCFACDPDHPGGLRMRMWLSGEELATETAFGDDFCSYPGVVHGGIIATAADDLMANLILVLRRRLTFTTTLRIRYLRPVPTGSVCRVVARLLGGADGAIRAEADALVGDEPHAVVSATYRPIPRAALSVDAGTHRRMRPFLDSRDDLEE